ncbi:MAG: M14 family zinc carboxypeptidase, partial [Sphingobacterium sp.]
MMKTNLHTLGLGAVIFFQSCTGMLPNDKSNFKDTMPLDTAQYNTLHERYKENELIHRRFKHNDIAILVNKHQEHGVLKVDEIGKSFEDRSIYKLQYGRGEKKVMLWSQMHGDEPTATMALFDLFNFLEGREDGYDSIRTLLNDNLEMHFIPMLNPDGAQRYTRKNAQYIDLNRDARESESVEGGLLRAMAQKIKPSYGFNLHDQNIYYNVPGTNNPVAISVLAPAYNVEREVNDVRKGAMQLIVGMNNLLQQYIPSAVAKYDDTYSPRGFGDNFQSWGASTVLIESGGLKGDPEKQEIRKMNFAIILQALIEIAQGSYQQYEHQEYDQIPFSASQLHDEVIRNLDNGSKLAILVTDIAIRRSETTVEKDFYVRGHVEDIGDLADFYGYDDIDASNLSFVPGKTYPEAFESVDAITQKRALELLKEGYIAVKVNHKEDNELHNLPLVVVTSPDFTTSTEIVPYGSTNFFLSTGGTLKYAIVNGYVMDLSSN